MNHRPALPAGAWSASSDVDRQRRHGQPGARYRRRALSPDRRQPGDDAAPRARMARHASAAPARLRRPGALRGPRPGAAVLRRRRRGEPHAADAGARRARPRDFRLRRGGGPFPARQHEQASRVVARRHALDPERTVFVEQSPSGDRRRGVSQRRRRGRQRAGAVRARAGLRRPGRRLRSRSARNCPRLEIVTVPASAVSLAEAVRSYLFNAQLVTLPAGEMALVVPSEARDSAAGPRWLDAMLAGNGPIRRVIPVDVRQSMANGGGPACLRLRVVADPATVDPRFLLDERKAARDRACDRADWPEADRPGRSRQRGARRTGHRGAAGLARGARS